MAKEERSKEERLEDVGRSAMESIAEMVARLEAVQQVSDCCGAEMTEGNGACFCDECERPCDKQDGDEPDDDAREKAREEIQEDPLSLEVRGDWHSPGDDDSSPVEFCLLLATGGPAVRIVGELSCGDPMRPRLEVQDWFTPWTEYIGADRGILLTYCQQFYFGEG